MIIKSRYNFKEAKLGPDFAKEKMAEFRKLIDSGISFTVLSMPGVGVSYFLKFLVTKSFANFIYIDLYALPSLTQHEFYKLIYSQLSGKTEEKSDEILFASIRKVLIQKINESKPDEKIVLVFSRFDQLKKEFNNDLFSNLQSLTTITPGKIVLIFTSIKPLYEIAPEAVKGGNLPFYSKVYYFKPFLKKELIELFTLDHTLKAHPELEKLAEISGGHNQLLHIFINSHKQNSLLLDKFVTLQLKDLINYLDYQQKKQVQKITLGKRVEDIDEYLLETGYVLQTKTGPKLFSPILEEYIKTNLPVKLPVKEKALFNLLRKNTGKVVSKDEIFNSVWGENNEDATDWALDALIYRLRKHPFIKAHGYLIESQKKVGYTLIQV